jgi:hypothetical protein
MALDHERSAMLMTTVHAQLVGDKAVLPRDEFDRLIALARQTVSIDLQAQEEDLPNLGLLLLAEKGGAFNWLANEPDLYSLDDLKVRYR